MQNLTPYLCEALIEAMSPGAPITLPRSASDDLPDEFQYGHCGTLGEYSGTVLVVSGSRAHIQLRLE